MATSPNRIKITLKKSVIGTPDKHRRVVRALGLKRTHQSIEHDSSPTILGMVRRVSHLLTVEPVTA